MFKRIVWRLSQMPRNRKQLILVAMDMLFVSFSLWAAYSLRFGQPYEPFGTQIWLWVISPFIALPIFIYFDLYRAIIRYIGFKGLWSLIQAVSLYGLAWGMMAFLSGIPLIPRSVAILNWLLCLMLVAGSRMFVRWWFVGRWQILGNGSIGQNKKVLIYGAGSAGVQLALALHYDTGLEAVAYVDDDVTLHGNYINGLKVVGPEDIEAALDEADITEILLAIPSLKRSQRKVIFRQLEQFSVPVRTLPGVADIAQGKVKVEDIRDVDIEDLLGRDSVKPIDELLAANIKDKVVLVTGAGGSIGSELCRQIALNQPEKLILFELNEYHLYQIEKELAEQGHTNVVSVLGSVQCEKRIHNVCIRYNVQTIYHAAAYKHVPIIEDNPVMGVENNVFGTLNAAKAAKAANVEIFVLISTDKAVRPTNVMGATKRFAEMILQDLSQKQPHTTRFAMVRFGNVLGSSGSVVPLFREQIKNGGPVTVTASDMVRYFMTIREAALLVIQAGALSRSGDMFLLKMGEPVLIMDLAKQMIRLSGLEIADENNPDGDIEIKVTGIRPGEKLYEELLIEGTSSDTVHPRIFRADENDVCSETLEAQLSALRLALEASDMQKIQTILEQGVNGYKPKANIRDIGSLVP